MKDHGTGDQSLGREADWEEGEKSVKEDGRRESRFSMNSSIREKYIT